MDTVLRSLLADRNLRLVDLANLVGVDKATVTRWARRRIPAERVLDVERLTGVPRGALRPDLYPAEMSSPVAINVNRKREYVKLPTG